MADPIDIGNDRAQEMLNDALAKRKPPGPPPCGFCYNCGEAVPGGLRYCDADCQSDHSRRNTVERDREGRYYDE